jgi:hypothetical protein
MADSALPLPTPKWDGVTERAARLRIAIQPVCFARVSAAPRISVARIYKSVTKPPRHLHRSARDKLRQRWLCRGNADVGH